MVTRGLGVLLVTFLLCAGGGVVQVDTAAQNHAARITAQCHGVSHRAIRGAEPTYTRKLLAAFTNDKLMCRGIWLPRPRRRLVPQGIAITGHSAWISGFHHRDSFGKRPCRLIQVGLRTGRLLALHRAIKGQVGKRPRTYCRHGGGIARRGRLLWVAEASKLWLVDPSQRSSVIEAQRVWRIESPVRGSAVVATRSRIGLVPFQTRGVARIHWFSIRALLKPGVLDLATRSRGKSQLGTLSTTRIPRAVQGATLTRAGRLYLSRSNLACGELVTPSGRRLAFIPGAEGIEFSGTERRLWTVSESGARPYAVIKSEPLTPAVASFEWPGLWYGKPARCGFPLY